MNYSATPSRRLQRRGHVFTAGRIATATCLIVLLLITMLAPGCDNEESQDGNGSSQVGAKKIRFLHLSTGGAVYNYSNKGVSKWFSEYNSAHGTNLQISDQEYPSPNMPADYYERWIEDDELGSFVNSYDVIIFKHCFPASSILADTSNEPDFSQRKSIANYKAIYRALRQKLDQYPDDLFIVWTLPPLHRLATTSDEAARATQFSEWMVNDWLDEDGKSHSNIRVWDFRSIVMDSDDNYLKYEYELSHSSSDSHPNSTANNAAGPLFAEFIVEAMEDFYT